MDWFLNDNGLRHERVNSIIKKYCSCCIMLIRIDTILSENMQNSFQNLPFKKLLAQSGDQEDIFRKCYSPADTLWLPKTVERVLGYTTVSICMEDRYIYIFKKVIYELGSQLNQICFIKNKECLKSYKVMLKNILIFRSLLQPQAFLAWRSNFLPFLKKTLWLLSMDGVQLPRGQSHFEEAVYFLPLSPQKFLVLTLSTSEG